MTTDALTESQRRYRTRKAAGVCVSCGGERDGKQVQCKACRRAAAKRLAQPGGTAPPVYYPTAEEIVAGTAEIWCRKRWGKWEHTEE